MNAGEFKRKKKPTPEELIEDFRKGHRREVARFMNSCSRRFVMTFAVTFYEELGLERFESLLALMTTEHERKQL